LNSVFKKSFTDALNDGPCDDLLQTTTLRTSAVPRSRGGPTVEKLSFHNHTECVCVDRLEEFMPRDRPSSGNDKDNVGMHGFRGYYRPDADRYEM
jgi:hypothetical protein